MIRCRRYLESGKCTEHRRRDCGGVGHCSRRWLAPEPCRLARCFWFCFRMLCSRPLGVSSSIRIYRLMFWISKSKRISLANSMELGSTIRVYNYSYFSSVLFEQSTTHIRPSFGSRANAASHEFWPIRTISIIHPGLYNSCNEERFDPWYWSHVNETFKMPENQLHLGELEVRDKVFALWIGESQTSSRLHTVVADMWLVCQECAYQWGSQPAAW